MTTDQLLAMVIEAHAAMLSEAMDCPWCGTGYISAHREEHEPTCEWMAVRPKADDTQPTRSNP